MMNSQTALLITRQTAEADRLSVVSGLSIIDLMDRAGSAVAREIGRRLAEALLQARNAPL
jgi:NAD(P)H-hydrate repair Nnr-like enzyme with NAD(P)H-hydrate epimerase domain